MKAVIVVSQAPAAGFALLTTGLLLMLIGRSFYPSNKRALRIDITAPPAQIRQIC